MRRHRSIGDVSPPHVAAAPADASSQPEAQTATETDRSAIPARRRLLARRVAGTALVATGLRYMIWRPGTVRGTGLLGVAFLAAEIAVFLYVFLAIGLMWKERRRTAPDAPPAGTLDVFITVCGEPVHIVEETLKAALAIEYPHTTYLLNDGYIAGKEGWRDIEKLGRRYAVPVLRRTTGSRRKAGNLNHALKRSKGEFVAVIDADHQAHPDFAHQTLGYFADERVALVSTRQDFRVDGKDVLGNLEILFYDSLQPAKDASNAAFSTGNAALYRRTALDRIGGFSEWNLLEDLHTTYELHAAGWHSVYHPRSLTVGLAPQTGASLVRQRLQWATDSLRVMFWDNPLFKRGLRPMQRLHYFHTVAYYLIACLHVLFLLGPALHLLWQVPVMRPESLGSYLSYAIPYLGSMATFVLILGGRRGGLRGIQSSLFLAPLYPLAVLRALTGIRFRMRVNAKVAEPSWSMLLLPHLVVLLLSIGGIFLAFTTDRGDSRVSAVWAAWTVFVLAGLVGTVSARKGIATACRVALRGPVLVAVAVLMVSVPQPQFSVEPEFVRVQGAIEPAVPSATARATPRRTGIGPLAPPETGAYMGVFTPDLLMSGDEVLKWNKARGVDARIANWYQHWMTGEPRFREDWIRMIARQGAVPMITWEPWAKPEGSVHSQEQPDFTHEQIASGRYDDYIRTWARAAARYRGPFMIRFMHEMNGNWYPWSIRTNGNTPDSYVTAWRHVHDIFVAEGATNVTWVWTVNAFAGMTGDFRDIERYYPGDEYVDWVSATGFNWGDSHRWNAWRTFGDVFRDTYIEMYQFRKPILISEIGTVDVGGDAAQWVRETLEELRDYPLVKGVVWFDSRYSAVVDFRLRGRIARSFTEAVRARDYFDIKPVFNEPPAPPPSRSVPPPGWLLSNRTP
ncbi:MAG TPA: glycosyltransferase [Actinomycetota bacterium]